MRSLRVARRAKREVAPPPRLAGIRAPSRAPTIFAPFHGLEAVAPTSTLESPEQACTCSVTRQIAPNDQDCCWREGGEAGLRGFSRRGSGFKVPCPQETGYPMPPRLKHAELHGRIGTARTTVTPPVGIYSRTWGSAQHDVAEGVHRPALASCLVFQSLAGDSELVFITMDSCCADDGEVAAIRAKVLQHFGLRPEQLMLHP